MPIIRFYGRCPARHTSVEPGLFTLHLPLTFRRIDRVALPPSYCSIWRTTSNFISRIAAIERRRYLSATIFAGGFLAFSMPSRDGGEQREEEAGGSTSGLRVHDGVMRFASAAVVSTGFYSLVNNGRAVKHRDERLPRTINCSRRNVEPGEERECVRKRYAVGETILLRVFQRDSKFCSKIVR